MFGVEPICRVLTSHGLEIATSTYYAAKKRTPSVRSIRDVELKTRISRVHTDNYSLYGVRKVRRQLHREGVRAARCTIARLMRDLGLEGARHGNKIRTTIRDDGQERAGDLLQRDFTASRPDGRWVADFTYVATRSGTVYVAFVVDMFSRAIMGRSAATGKRAELVLDALDMLVWRRDLLLPDGRVRTRGPSAQGSLRSSRGAAEEVSPSWAVMGCGRVKIELAGFIDVLPTETYLLIEFANNVRFFEHGRQRGQPVLRTRLRRTSEPAPAALSAAFVTRPATARSPVAAMLTRNPRHVGR